jgi:Pentapeptide repeats (8 copies)
MDQMDELRSAVKILLEKAQNAPVSDLASAVEKVTGVLRLSADLEKSQAELRKLTLEESKIRHEIDSAPKRERSESLKEYVSLLAPIVTILTLAATLIVQGWQFSQSEKDKREAAEDAQWADAVKTISQNSKLAPTVIAINPFLKSPRYRDPAKAYAVQILANSSDEILFADLFGAAFVPASWNTLDQVLRLDRALRTRQQPLDTKTYIAEKDTNDFEKLTVEEKNAANYDLDALTTICTQIDSVLKSPRPKGVSLDLSGTYLYNCDWGGVDLSGANLDGAGMIYVDVKGASLANITQFSGAYIFHVAWWEAENVSPALLQFLEENPDSKYKEGAKYGPRYQTFTPVEYATAVRRIEHQKP